MRLNHFLGGVFLIAGTAIGAGMLALPVTTGFAGFYPTLLSLVLCWLYLTTTAFLFLEVNLAFPGPVNLVSMAYHTLGNWGKGISWTIYLCLLYFLTAAYLAGSAPFFSYVFKHLFQVELSPSIAALLFLLCFGIFVYLGTRSVDLINRFFIFGVVISYILLIFLLPEQFQPVLIQHKDFSALFLGIPVITTSFGFHIVIPSLTQYMNRNVRKLKAAILLGSAIPLFVYALWEFFILGVLPLQGENSLALAWRQGSSITTLLAKELHYPRVALSAQLFSFFAIATSFLGVSLSLSDFLADGLKVYQRGKKRFGICLLAFMPPLFFVWFYPQAFIVALQYAAIFVALLLGILPALMAWKLPQYQSLGKKALLLSLIAFSLGVIFLDLIGEMGYLNRWIQPYLE